MIVEDDYHYDLEDYLITNVRSILFMINLLDDLLYKIYNIEELEKW